MTRPPTAGWRLPRAPPPVPPQCRRWWLPATAMTAARTPTACARTATARCSPHPLCVDVGEGESVGWSVGEVGSVCLQRDSRRQPWQQHPYNSTSVTISTSTTAAPVQQPAARVKYSKNASDSQMASVGGHSSAVSSRLSRPVNAFSNDKTTNLPDIHPHKYQSPQRTHYIYHLPSIIAAVGRTYPLHSPLFFLFFSLSFCDSFHSTGSSHLRRGGSLSGQ